MTRKFTGKLGVMETGESKLVVILFDAVREAHRTAYIFSCLDYFSAFNRVVLEVTKENEESDIQLWYDSTYEDEERLEWVLLPDHVNLKELAAFLDLLDRGEIHHLHIDFAYPLFISYRAMLG